MLRRLITLLVLTAAFASTANAGNETWHWGGMPDRAIVLQGTIDGKYAVLMTLQFKDESVNGDYFYQSVGVPLSVTGKRNPEAEGLCTLIESEHIGDKGDDGDSKQTGQWSIKPSRDGNQWTGTWTKADGEKTYPVQLKRVAEYDLLSRTIRSATAEAQTPRLLLQNPLLTQAIDALADEHVSGTAQYLDETRKDLQRMAAEGEAEYVERQHYYSASTTHIDHLDDRVASLNIMYYDYSGGAHGNYGYSTRNYVIKNGKVNEIQLADLFRNDTDWIKLLQAQMLIGLKAAKAEWIPNPSDEDYEKNMDPKLFESFTIAPHGPTFYFGPYQYGSFARGAITVRIPWKDLKPVLDPSGPAGPWLK